MPVLNLVDNFIIDGTAVNLVITQGATYQISFRYPGYVLTAEPSGQIRTKYAQDANELLAEFTFLQLVYDPVDDKTLITAELSADVTATLPYTKYQGVGDTTIRNCHVYDIELRFSNGVVDKIVPASFVQVKPEVTI